jgi:hypothetical protein
MTHTIFDPSWNGCDVIYGPPQWGWRPLAQLETTLSHVKC